MSYKTDNSSDAIVLDIEGLGIIVYSPASAAHVREGEDYLSSHFMAPADVESHILAGTIVGFSTGSPGTFIVRYHRGYPSTEELTRSECKLRLGLRCTDGVVVFRDMFDLLEWTAEYPPEQALALPVGIYHITLCSNIPSSGILGDNQQIDAYFQRLEEFPRLSLHGVPMLCA